MRTKVSVLLISVLLLSCAAVQIHPGAVNKADSEAYDVLLVAQAVIEQARSEAAGGNLAESLKPPLNVLVDSYNLARASWLTYRAAVKANAPANATGLKRQIDALTAALNSFNQKRSIP